MPLRFSSQFQALRVTPWIDDANASFSCLGEFMMDRKQIRKQMAEKLKALEQDNLQLSKRVEQLEKLVEMLWYAPGAPGYLAAKLDFENLGDMLQRGTLEPIFYVKICQMNFIKSVINVPPDGNCLFHSIAAYLPPPMNHVMVHAEIHKELLKHPKRYKDFIADMAYSDNVAQMSQDGTFGCHVTLHAAARAFKINILVYDLSLQCFAFTGDFLKFSKYAFLI
ncbi:hypothetical protein M427DRAFT_50124 [Gonapodya prolifera JEL478]|uniref:OTU domain-containing protein n=1 Tax=Gonapodya prolifera (strain JEL478) TaxID=1344416 RepID=A0A138ZWW4_GONPJ|nr:hypothetical protein M427DRAFT_50124 [Gonapodya prolifera JEL478]|eukprot:KXS08978.1 hypothetical protein M427DRAFT_50124 [Gonapodya prolifera JEL478]